MKLYEINAIRDSFQKWEAMLEGAELPIELLKSMLANQCQQICMLAKKSANVNVEDFEEIISQMDQYCCQNHNILTLHNEELIEKLALFEKIEQKMTQMVKKIEDSEKNDVTILKKKVQKTEKNSLSSEKAQTVQGVYKFLQSIEQKLGAGPAKKVLRKFLGKTIMAQTASELNKPSNRAVQPTEQLQPQLVHLQTAGKNGHSTQKRRRKRDRKMLQNILLFAFSAIAVHAAFVILSLLMEMFVEIMAQPVFIALATLWLFNLLRTQQVMILNDFL
uniref:Uncharacterized protein n=1 Tax=Globodera rostochiensis TaxID=31243 RepID=A0A914H3C9_GLORO